MIKEDEDESELEDIMNDLVQNNKELEVIVTESPTLS
jgi:hypothetical protein